MIASITITLVLCYTSEVLTQNIILEVAETDTNVLITCGGHITGESRQFWIINEALYGFLQVPREYRVSLTQQELVIPALRRDMNGSTFQCVRIDHQNNIIHYGMETQLKIITLPFELPNGMVCSNLTNSIILFHYIHRYT